MTSNPLLHPLDGVVARPKRFNNPFYYEPDALCRRAIQTVVDYLEGRSARSFAAQGPSADFLGDIAKGKMFGVLVVESPHLSPSADESSLPPCDAPSGTAQVSAIPSSPSLAFLCAYSGQVCGRSDWPFFVPAVFDYLQEDGYFKREEARIVAINEQLDSLPTPLSWDEQAIADPRPGIEKGRRATESEDEYIRRRQFENARLHRWKVAQRERRTAFEQQQRQKAEKIQSLKTLRRQKSDALQGWLFRHFVMRNALGQHRNLMELWQGEGLPPAGSGECCEPKLLQYAYAHGLRPVSMAMFWWGASPLGEVRHHLQCYPACNGKCKPILRWMLQGLDVDPNPLEADSRHTLDIVYEDDAICVVNKPSGMLSVQGKSRRESVQTLMRQRHPHTDSPLIVHRLDMSTSGLMVVAKTMAAYRDLQRQFLRHDVRKRYVAELSHELSQASGDITLPLRPDLDDRPRQVVDEVYGKPAATHFEALGGCRVALWPHTGRTHQLRVHCAHRLGLDNPIRGDELYGQRADRLHLHAETLSFCHPTTGAPMTFTAPAPF